MTVQGLKLLQGKASGLFLYRQKKQLLAQGGLGGFLLSLGQAGLNGGSIFAPSFPSFGMISVMYQPARRAAAQPWQRLQTAGMWLVLSWPCGAALGSPGLQAGLETDCASLGLRR